MGAYLILELGGFFGFFECFLEGRVFIKFQCNIGQFSGNFWRFWLILLLFFFITNARCLVHGEGYFRYYIYIYLVVLLYI